MKDNKQSFWMSEKEYLLVTKKIPIPTVNLVILRRYKNNWEILMLTRKTGYAKGQWCIIGGRVYIGESLNQAIDRQADDLKVKVKILPPFNSNFPSFIDDQKNQDKTKSPLSFVYPVEIKSGEVREEGKEYKCYEWFPINNLPQIAYGQKLQIRKCIEQLKKFGDFS